MRLAFQPINFLSGVLVGALLSSLAFPLWKLGVMRFEQERFGELTFRCDNSMRVHFIATQKLAEQPSNENVLSVKSAEIGLLDCQDYDLMRKRLIRWGLTDNELSEMSLIAIEDKSVDLKEVIKIHEIRY